MTARPLPKSAQPPPGVAGLTPREREILGYVARGVSSRDAARALGISIRTVEAHRRQILKKTGARYVSEVAGR